jgi:hypothetical protein
MDWLSSDHMGTPTDMKATMVQQQRNVVFYVVHADELQARDKVRAWSVSLWVEYLVGREPPFIKDLSLEAEE